MATRPRVEDHRLGQLKLPALVDERVRVEQDGKGPVRRQTKPPASRVRRRGGDDGGATGHSGPVPPDPNRRQLLLTVDEAARELHIGRRQTWEMVWRGELPVVRLGPRTLRVAYPVLQRFVLERSGTYAP